MTTDSPVKTVTVHIEDVPLSSITDALLAIELYDERLKGLDSYDESHARLTRLVLGLREAGGRNP